MISFRYLKMPPHNRFSFPGPLISIIRTVGQEDHPFLQTVFLIMEKEDKTGRRLARYSVSKADPDDPVPFNDMGSGLDQFTVAV